MKITSYTFNQNKNIYPEFCSKAKVINKPFVTALDKQFFRDYMTAKKVDLNIGKEELQELLQYDEEEFIVRANDLLANKFKISSKIKPTVAQGSADTFMQYSPIDNAINVSYNYLSFISTHDNKDSKILTFALLRREWQHYMQVVDVFRHENLGEKAVNKYSQDKLYEQMDIFSKIATTVENNKEKWRLGINYTKTPSLLKLLNYINIKELSKFKKNVRKELGIIKEGTPESERAKILAANLFQTKEETKPNTCTGSINDYEARIAAYTELTKLFSDSHELSCFIHTRKILNKIHNLPI